jgi:hypothetical protein
MRALALALTLPLAGTPTAPSPGTEETRIAWRFEKGDVLRYRNTMEMEQTVSGPADVTVKTTTAQVLAQKVLAVDDDGTASMKCTWEALRMRVAAPMGAGMEYDSTDPASTPPQAMKGLARLVGLAFDMRMRPTGEVLALQGVDAAVAKLFPEGEPSAAGMKAAFAGMLDEEGLKRTLETAVWPEQPVAVDDTWERDVEMPIGPLGTLRAHYRYTYEGPAEELGAHCAKVGVEFTMTAGASKPDFSHLPGADVLDVEVEIGDSDGSGTLWFSTERGRLVRSDMATGIELVLRMSPKEPLEGHPGPMVVRMDMKMRVETRLLGADEPAFERERRGRRK